MVLLGLLLATVGADLNSGVSRYTFGQLELFDGLHVVLVAMGIFGLSEIIGSVREQSRDVLSQKITLRSMLPTRDDFRRSWMPIIRGSGIGSIIGILPGAGGSMAAFMSYGVEKRASKEPYRFGKGAIEGVAGPEASNNSAAQTAFVPTLTMGIPGSASMALMLGALMINGIAPGPALIRDHPDMFWGLVMSFWVGNILLVVLNIPLIGVWIRLLMVPYRLLFPVIVGLICVGVFSVSGNVFDVFLIAGIGFVGYFLRLLQFEPAPLLIGFVLGPMLEENFRRSMVLGRGDLSFFLTRPLSLAMLLIAIAMVLWAVVSALRTRWSTNVNPIEEN